METNTSEQSAHIFAQFGKDISLVFCATSILYVVVQAVSLYLLEKSPSHQLGELFFVHIFSFSMLPSMLAYALLVAIIYHLYQKTKKMMNIIHAKELQSEREQAVVQTSQKITAMIVEYIAVHNTEITQWLQKRREKGMVPQMVEKANANISLALKTLTELSFVMPYLDAEMRNVDDYVTYLRNKLQTRIDSAYPLLEY